MRDSLIIFLNARELASSSWLVLNSDGTTSAPAICSEEALATIKQDRVITVLVPAEDVLLLTVNLPSMSRHRLMQALPFTLEEQLIDDVETQHIVSSLTPEPDGLLPVAVVAHEKMRTWLEQLKTWNIQPNRMLPVSLALPWTPTTWHMIVDSLCICRTGKDLGFAGEQTMIADYIKAAIAASSTPPEQMVILNYTATPMASMAPLPIMAQEVQRDPASFLLDLARGLEGASSLNLLQGVYAPKRQRFNQAKKISRMAGWLAVVFVTMLFLLPLVSTFILQQRVSKLNSQIAAIYYRQFPNASSVVSPKRRMEDKLHQVMSQLGSNRFLLLMGYVGKGMQAAPSVMLKRLQFQDNHLSMDISAASTADFSAFTEYLKQQSLTVKQQNASVVGARVNAIVEVE